jgi:hypothetical protein
MKAFFARFLKSESGAVRIDYGLIVGCAGFLIFKVITSPGSSPSGDDGDALLRVN